MTQENDSGLEKMVCLLYSTIVPFVSASLFYFEQAKNIAFALVLLDSIMDFTNSEPSGKLYNVFREIFYFNFPILDVPFEFTLCLGFICSIVLTHLLFCLYSFTYAEEIFELSHHSNCSMVSLT